MIFFYFTQILFSFVIYTGMLIPQKKLILSKHEGLFHLGGNKNSIQTPFPVYSGIQTRGKY